MSIKQTTVIHSCFLFLAHFIPILIQPGSKCTAVYLFIVGGEKGSKREKEKRTHAWYVEASCLGLSLQTLVQVLYFCIVL